MTVLSMLALINVRNFTWKRVLKGRQRMSYSVNVKALKRAPIRAVYGPKTHEIDGYGEHQQMPIQGDSEE